MQFNEGFIGYSEDAAYENFSGADSKELFETNLRSQPIDWYYRRADIIYQRNTFGHRCKNLNEINLDNYILFTGCSHTEGIGVELEKTHAYQVAEQIGCDYYNLAVGGTGVDVIAHNLSVWFATVHNKPKALVVQWPALTRFVTQGNFGKLRLLGAWSGGEDESKFLYHAENLDYFNTKKKIANALINQISKTTKVIHVSMCAEVSDFGEEYIRGVRLDFARDLSHFGIKSHTKIANEILARL